MRENDVIQAFVESMASLMAVMKDETEMLAQRRYHDLAPLQQRKTTLARTYEQFQTAVQQNPGCVSALSAPERADLKVLYKRFRETLADNMLALRAGHDATERVIKTIIDTVKKQRGIGDQPKAYGNRPRGVAAYACAGNCSFAFNQQI